MDGFFVKNLVLIGNNYFNIFYKYFPLIYCMTISYYGNDFTWLMLVFN